MSVWNFAFGSHLSKKQLRRVIGREPRQAVRAVLPDHKLTFWGLAQFPEKHDVLALGGTAVIIAEEGRRVYGAAYLISDQELRVLDEYESEWEYQRVQVQVRLESGELMPAHAHNRIGVGKFAPPSPSCLQLMLEGLKEHGYPTSVINEVREAAEHPI